MSFQKHKYSLCSEIISRCNINPYPTKLHALTDTTAHDEKGIAFIPPNKELPTQILTSHYRSMQAIMQAEICQNRMDNKSYQYWYERAKSLIKKKVGMKFYDTVNIGQLPRHRHIRISLGAGLLQVRD